MTMDIWEGSPYPLSMRTRDAAAGAPDEQSQFQKLLLGLMNLKPMPSAPEPPKFVRVKVTKNGGYVLGLIRGGPNG